MTETKEKWNCEYGNLNFYRRCNNDNNINTFIRPMFEYPRCQSPFHTEVSCPTNAN